ncbi:MAG TPA: amino acid dehydrogenase, partial [Thermoanaerobaculia bacterium]|nr:amino acid dehydrogenase [Thermoanaerobaculia bacterium]
AADDRFAVIPDFIANCGMARLFAYLMHDGATVDEESMKGDISRTVRAAMARLFDGFSGETGLLERGFTLYVP